MVFWLNGTEMTEETYTASTFNAAVHFSATLIGLLIALAELDRRGLNPIGPILRQIAAWLSLPL